MWSLGSPRPPSRGTSVGAAFPPDTRYRVQLSSGDGTFASGGGQIRDSPMGKEPEALAGSPKGVLPPTLLGWTVGSLSGSYERGLGRGLTKPVTPWPLDSLSPSFPILPPRPTAPT